jgi:putative endonuclease
MYFYVYMLISNGNKPVSYVGYTNNLKNRIKLHNSGKGAKFTRGRKWKLIYKEKFTSKNKAILREYYIKKNRLLRNKIKNENFNTTSL